MPQSLSTTLAGRRVESVRCPGALALGLSGELTVTVTGDFRLSGPHGVEHFYPSLAGRPTGGLLRLPASTVTAAGTTQAGALVLSLDCGLTLTVPPDATTAPWTVTTPAGPLFTALPGGYSTTPG
ncbi:DUF6188 family protein [Kitasatospora sp. NPDC002227]|uniref:DUF6188 family protein n=1 Tax=Kitasatospora sp. NPDC002227 TaxID=3154773 RepID=UPI0033317B04